MNVAEIKKAVEQLSSDELAEVSAFVARIECSIWDQQIDADFAPGGRLHSVLQEVEADFQAGKIDELP